MRKYHSPANSTSSASPRLTNTKKVAPSGNSTTNSVSGPSAGSSASAASTSGGSIPGGSGARGVDGAGPTSTNVGPNTNMMTHRGSAAALTSMAGFKLTNTNMTTTNNTNTNTRRGGGSGMISASNNGGSSSMMIRQQQQQQQQSKLGPGGPFPGGSGGYGPTGQQNYQYAASFYGRHDGTNIGGQHPVMVPLSMDNVDSVHHHQQQRQVHPVMPAGPPPSGATGGGGAAIYRIPNYDSYNYMPTFAKDNSVSAVRQQQQQQVRMADYEWSQAYMSGGPNIARQLPQAPQQQPQQGQQSGHPGSTHVQGMPSSSAVSDAPPTAGGASHHQRPKLKVKIPIGDSGSGDSEIKSDGAGRDGDTNDENRMPGLKNEGSDKSGLSSQASSAGHSGGAGSGGSSSGWNTSLLLPPLSPSAYLAGGHSGTGSSGGHGVHGVGGISAGTQQHSLGPGGGGGGQAHGGSSGPNNNSSTGTGNTIQGANGGSGGSAAIGGNTSAGGINLFGRMPIPANGEQTPLSAALPSKYVNDLLPSPSNFYGSEWNASFGPPSAYGAGYPQSAGLNSALGAGGRGHNGNDMFPSPLQFNAPPISGNNPSNSAHNASMGGDGGKEKEPPTKKIKTEESVSSS